MRSPFRLLLATTLLALIIAVFYFSWVPDPALQKISWLPSTLAAWADRHVTLRTGVPFLLLGAVAGLSFMATGREWKSWTWLLVSLVELVTVAEAGQFFISKRVFDWRDIGWGITGSVLGLFPPALGCWWRQRKASARITLCDNVEMSPNSHLFYFLGISFWNQSTEDLLKLVDAKGGLLAVPSAPSLGAMDGDVSLSKAYQASDWAVMDGGYVALILRFFFGKSIRRISGLQLLQKLVSFQHNHAVPMEDRTILWVVPNGREKDAIRNYLLKGNFDLNRQHFYEAPFYKTDADFKDQALLTKVKTSSPDWIILCIGGGRQEKLGHFIRQQFDQFNRKPVILCTGGAISFLTGTQANIPTWADRLYLGWLLRIFSNPRLFGVRYFDAAWRFPKLLWKSRRTLFDENKAAEGTLETPGVL